MITLAPYRRVTARSRSAVSSTLPSPPRESGAGSGSGAGFTSSASFTIADAYDEHGPALFRFALNAVGDRGLAEECVQETFTRAWRARDRYDADIASARTWLFAIARNVIKDSFRRRAKTPVPIDDPRVHHLTATEPDPDEALIMMEALATLSDEHRQAVVAIHLVGVSYSELSAAEGVPVATLRSRTFYGLRALRRHFERGQAGDD